LVPQRSPLTLAKEMTALDYHSGGRFILGVAQAG
jgi:alkanesulfonate monooxygenase SsuD/methylene tetrahydromethanopterin reductase-like flavin-dependent oxidoreductase (luciferase family)